MRQIYFVLELQAVVG